MDVPPGHKETPHANAQTCPCLHVGHHPWNFCGGLHGWGRRLIFIFIFIFIILVLILVLIILRWWVFRCRFQWCILGGRQLQRRCFIQCRGIFQRGGFIHRGSVFPGRLRRVLGGGLWWLLPGRVFGGWVLSGGLGGILSARVLRGRFFSRWVLWCRLLQRRRRLQLNHGVFWPRPPEFLSPPGVWDGNPNHTYIAQKP